MFLIDENGYYQAQSLIAIPYLMALAVMIILIIVVHRNRSYFNKQQFAGVLLYLVFPIVGIICEIITGLYGFTGISVTLSLLLVYTMLQSKVIDEYRIRQSLLEEISSTDLLTQLNNRRSYYNCLSKLDPQLTIGVVFCDVNGLKYTNDNYGHSEGDLLLVHFAEILSSVFDLKDIFRISGDEFVVVSKMNRNIFNRKTEELKKSVKDNNNIAAVGCSYGKGSEVEELVAQAESAMYENKREYYFQNNVQCGDSLEDALALESPSDDEYRDLIKAFDQKEFVAYYQPQYNNYTGMLVGAEALCRWVHKTRGMISPGYFIPLMEKLHLISKLDLYMFRQVCIFQRKCLDEKSHMVPVSVNLSWDDFAQEDFIDSLESIRVEYNVPVEHIRIEITESVASQGKQAAKAVVDAFHRYGYVIELDDFGAGYSSLNILKDIDYDVLKLDMSFLSDDMSGKGGTILSSIVRMAKWLSMPVISEGVETQTQLDFIKSIGCEYTQGYLFAKPMPEEEFSAILSSSDIGLTVTALNMKEKIESVNFWSENSLETLIFNSFVGPACIISYRQNDDLEILKLNNKYLKELGMNLSETDLINSSLFDTFAPESLEVVRAAIDRAISTEEEQEFEAWRIIRSGCCGDEKLYIRTNIILIGKSPDEYIFYAMIRNITSEKRRLEDGQAYETSFRNVIEQANIYYWEYNIRTKEMRPCFRCMRDLGLPPLVTNYPEPAIEQGIIPPDYADMYRDWFKQLEAGVPSLEAVIPLTVGRVPFHVRYTTEFDELGRPVLAYASATLVTEAEMK